MKTLLAVLVAILPGFFTSTARPLYKLLLALAMLAAITIWLLIVSGGCMHTLDLDGKVYRNRLDALTPITIGQTANGHPAPTAPTSKPAR